LPFLGPAFIASVAYVDPGNFATNIQGGAQFGYMLLWVIVASNLMAMLIQALSAKLGIATGQNLAEQCRNHFPRWLTVIMWALMEMVAMATDLAEFLGAALGFNLLPQGPKHVDGILDGIAVRKLVRLAQDLARCGQENGLGGSRSAVDADEALDRLRGFERYRHEPLQGVLPFEFVQLIGGSAQAPAARLGLLHLSSHRDVVDQAFRAAICAGQRAEIAQENLKAIEASEKML
jgi:hypothetical protein